MSATDDVWRGTSLAVLAAVSFGLTAPMVARAEGSALAVASILYAGAALAAWMLGGRAARAIRAKPTWPMLVMLLAGAVIAPTAFAWGVRRTGATTGSLLLNLEAPVTVLLAALVLRERVSRRVVLAVAVMGVAGVVATLDTFSAPIDLAPFGCAAVALACAGWGLDNVLARKLEAMEPLDVVLTKCVLGGATTGALALATGAEWPAAEQVASLAVAGAVGYGLSLRLYLGAQRYMGAARTGSVFALAPFLGALAAVAMGDRSAGTASAAAAVLFLVGVTLHATERPMPTPRGRDETPSGPANAGVEHQRLAQGDMPAPPTTESQLTP